MDWIEEKIEKLQRYLEDATLMRSLVFYLCATSMGAVAMWILTRNISNMWLDVMKQRIQETVWEQSNGRIEMAIYKISWLCNNSLYFFMFLSYLIAGKIFLIKKIYPTIEEITETLNAINAGDYSHEVSCYSGNEFGKINKGMEQLRRNLIREKRSQWKQQEEQRNINAAFAHDIRTPLTVIKGYTEFLQKNIPKGKISEEVLLEKLGIMKYQEERMLRFSNTMTELQRIEKREIVCRWIIIEEMVQRIRELTEVIEQNSSKKICICQKQDRTEILADCECIQEVLENLLNNAVRYAKEQIEIQIEINENKLLIYVKDDGKGFTDKAIREAAEVYFSEEENSDEHFGIGLSISKILCENHNGDLTFINSVEGGAIAAASFGIGIK